VSGEVEKPGEMRLTGTLTALQAVAMAAGFKDTARLTQAIVIRRNPDRTPLVIPLNLKQALDGTDVGQDIDLMPYDVLYVPKSTLANVNKFVDQLIRKNIPLNFGFVIRGDVDTLF
jgi:protein involved in polysaccharide export with SLBB domain